MHKIRHSWTHSIPPCPALKVDASRRGISTRSATALVGLALLFSACGDDESTERALQDVNFVLKTDVTTLDGESTLVLPLESLPEGDVDLGTAVEFPGFVNLNTRGEFVYIFESVGLTLTRYTLSDTAELVAGPSLNFSDRGFEFSNEVLFLSDTRAFVTNAPQLNLLEFNPTDMTITQEISLEALARDDFDLELRGEFVRASDSTMFIYVAYTNDRQTFVNDFTLAVVDLDSGEVSVTIDDQCPTSAGFGGFFDSAGDLYLIADSFGTFTRFLDTSDVKANCVVRVQSGERVLDSTYRFRPSTVMGDLEMWGLYQADAAGQQAFVSAIDLGRLGEFETPFEFIFAPIHPGWLVDLQEQSAQTVSNLPPDGVGFAGLRADGNLYVTRTEGTVEVEEIENTNSNVYAIEPSNGDSSLQFSIPGTPYLQPF